MKTLREKFKDKYKVYFTFPPFLVPFTEDFSLPPLVTGEQDSIHPSKDTPLYDGLFTPFSISNDTFSEHIRLAFKYPLLCLAAIVASFLTLNWLATLMLGIALPFTIAYGLIGLVTRSIATVADALSPTDAINNSNHDDCAEYLF